MLIYVLSTLADHKPEVGMRIPGQRDRKHVWICLSNLEFISCSGLVFLLDDESAVLSHFQLKLLGAYGRLLRAVRL